MLHMNTRGRRRVAIAATALAVGTFTLLPAGVFAQVPAAVEKAAGSATKAAGSATKAAAAAPQALDAAAKASPDLVTALSKELGSSPAQAAGAAGALFGV